MKLNLFLPIYFKFFDNQKFNIFLEKYFIDLHNLDKNKYINLDLSYNEKEFKENINFIKKKKKIYQKEILKILKLNNILYSEKLKICIDFFLIHFLSIIKIRYDKLIKLNKDVENLCLPKVQFNKFNFYNTEDFLTAFRNNSKNNLFIFQKIAEILSIKTHDFNFFLKNHKKILNEKKMRIKFLNFLLKIKKINLFIGMYIADLGFFRKIFFYLKNFIIPFNLENLDCTVKNETFADITIKVSEKDKFDKVSNILLNIFFPKILLSNKKLLHLYNFSKNIRSLNSSVGLISSENFRIIAGFLGNKKVKTFQHGSDYGVLKFNLIYDFEKNYSKFLSWKERLSANMFFLENKAQKKDKKKVTLYTTVYYHNSLRCESVFTNFKSNEDSIKKNSQFCQFLHKNIKKKIVIRNQKNDYGWDYKKKFFKYYNSKLKIEFDNKVDSVKTILDSKIIIVDHISTTFYMSLYYNTPTFAYCDLNKYHFNDKFKQLFSNLKKHQIIFEEPIQCAEFINRNYDIIEKIWFRAEMQFQISKFRDNYIFNNKNYK
jgi:putative transferase (TIGR04331 family)